MSIRLPLKLHPDSRCDAVRRVEVEIERPDSGTLILLYSVTGRIAGLSLPPAAPPARADGLWRHSCFEAFVRATADPGYWEFNFAPSTEWAAYRFSDYRMGMSEAADVAPPGFETRSEADCYELRACVELARPFGLLAELPWHVGLAAVIEETNGRRSYWALAHPPGAPDFHHETCFALELPPAPRP